MLIYMLFFTPVAAIILFVNCVSLAKKIRNGEAETANNTGWGSIMFAYIVCMIIVSNMLSE